MSIKIVNSTLSFHTFWFSEKNQKTTKKQADRFTNEFVTKINDDSDNK